MAETRRADYNPIIAVIDTACLNEAQTLIHEIKNHVGCFKIGLEFFIAQGPAGIKKLQDKAGAFPFFLDLKLHDIPNQITGAVRAALALEPDFLTLHSSGGRAMLEAALHAKQEIGAHYKTKLLGVSVLTTLGDEDLEMIGQNGPVADQVVRLADLCGKSGLDGMVCSAQDLELLKQAGTPSIDNLIKVTPGIRLDNAEGQSPKIIADDQKRILTPYKALKAGADYLVIGRPIAKADNKGLVLDQIHKEIEQASHGFRKRA